MGTKSCVRYVIIGSRGVDEMDEIVISTKDNNSWLLLSLIPCPLSNKILKPLLKNPENSYNKFLIKFINGVISVSEGEIKHIIGNDWFYNAFVMDDKLLKMVRKEVMRDFAVDLANHMEDKNIDDEVPHHYVENSLKKYLNKRFNIEPPMALK